jgi:hypothetical protein
MAYNKIQQTRTIRGLASAGADLMDNLYDVKIYFPQADGTPSNDPFASYPITVRATGFDIPDVETEVYPIKYHGVSINRPKTSMTFERKFDLEFREDAAFELRRRFTAWHMAVSDPVTGGVSNATNYFGRIEVGTVAGAYYSTTLAGANSDGSNAESIEDDIGHITSNLDSNPLALWAFYNVWVYKVGGPKFKTDGGDAGKFSVGFQYMDLDMPMYGNNPLDSSLVGWT